MFELRDITKDNFEESVALKTSDQQEGFVAPNLSSIAQAKVYPSLEIKAVYDAETMVGFVMYGLDQEKDRFFLCRLMIDERHQRKGYGRLATEAVIERLKEAGECNELYLCFVENNTAAEKLYESIGFERTGEIDDGEVVMKLSW